MPLLLLSLLLLLWPSAGAGGGQEYAASLRLRRHRHFPAAVVNRHHSRRHLAGSTLTIPANTCANYQARFLFCFVPSRSTVRPAPLLPGDRRVRVRARVLRCYRRPPLTPFSSSGIEEQTFSLLVDSGSSTLVVAAKGCSACASLGITPLFDTLSASATGFAAKGAYGGDGNKCARAPLY